MTFDLQIYTIRNVIPDTWWLYDGKNNFADLTFSRKEFSVIVRVFRKGIIEPIFYLCYGKEVTIRDNREYDFGDIILKATSECIPLN